MKKVWKWLLLALCTACALCAFAACKKGGTAVTHRHTFAHYIGREATCFKVGVKEHLECLICNKLFATETRKEVSAKDLEIECLPHTEVDDEAIEPTCTKNGRTAGKHCSVCYTVIEKQEVIPAGHKEIITDEAVAATCTESGLTEGRKCSVCDTVTAKQVVVPARGHKEVIDQAVAATCLDGKTEGKHCSVCRTVLIEQEAVPATGQHIWNKNVCAICDLYRYYTRGLQYELNEDKKSYSVSGIGTALDNIRIPAAYEGKPVTAIQERAFYDCKDLTGITIPDSVISIGDDAFNYSSLESVTIGNGVISIGEYAFHDCMHLQGIVIPKSVESIGKSAFDNCPHMTYITVESGNAAYYSKGDCLIETKSGKLLYGCKNSKIPLEGVTSIGDFAFFQCGITEITIPESVTSIGSYVFYRCGFTEITISKSVTSIGDYAFETCSNLTSIIYDGTIKEWNAITKGYCWNRDTGEFTVHCSDGDLDKEGNEIK